MNKILVETNAAGLKLGSRLRNPVRSDPGNGEINCKTIKVEAVSRHMSPNTSQMFVVFWRTITRNDVDLLAAGKEVFYVA